MKKLKLKYFLLIILLGVALPVAAQNTGSISGVVVDSANNSPLAGAVVKVEGTNIGALTDNDGKFVISNITPGVYNLRTSFLGYEISGLDYLQIAENEQLTLNFALIQKKKTDTKKVQIPIFRN